MGLFRLKQDINDHGRCCPSPAGPALAIAIAACMLGASTDAAADSSAFIPPALRERSWPVFFRETTGVFADVSFRLLSFG
jgi:hypothetical protein